MLDRLIDIDIALLLRVFQRIVDAVSRRYGIHFIAIATAFFVLSQSVWATMIIATAPIPFLAFILVWLWIFWSSVHEAQRTKAGRINFNVSSLLFCRLFHLIMIVMEPGFILMALSITQCYFYLLYLLFAIAWMYFISCNEGPPQERRVSRLLAFAAE